MKSTLESLIDTLVQSHAGTAGSARQKYLLRESLHALVRLAQAEQLRDMRCNVQLLTQPCSGLQIDASPPPGDARIPACEFAAPPVCRKLATTRVKAGFRRT